MDGQPFEGFSPPTQNWSKLPHQFIDALPLVKTISEMKVILYILRHTWGYQDIEKKITLDEFQNGRKDKKGNRLDSGTGLSRNAVKAGIASAIDHGFIVVETDAHDKARIKKHYSLKSSVPEGQTLTPRGSEDDPHLSKFDPRTEKETKRKKPNKYSTTTKLRDFEILFTKHFGKLSHDPNDPKRLDVMATIKTYGLDTVTAAIHTATVDRADGKPKSWGYVKGILSKPDKTNGGTNGQSRTGTRQRRANGKTQGSGHRPKPTKADEQVAIIDFGGE